MAENSRPHGRAHWMHLLLAVPFAAMIWIGSYNHAEPAIAGIPFFYWYQLLWIPAGALLLLPVYRAEEGRKMTPLLVSAVWTLLISAGALAWGTSYRGTHPFEASRTILTAQVTAYQIAGWAEGLGAMAFLIGIALLIGALARGRQR